MSTGGPLRVGDVLHGFCGGAFGRDVYKCKRVEAIGSDWVVTRTARGAANAITGVDPEALTEYRSLEDRYDCTCGPGEN